MNLRLILSFLAALIFLGLGLPACSRLRTGSNDKNLRVFQDRIDGYMRLRREAERSAPPLPEKASPEQINAHQTELANAIRDARRGANQGDIFTPEITREIRRIIAEETKGPGGAPARHSLKEGNPRVEGGPQVRLSANARYPDSAPLSLVPPELLLKLPKLPEDLRYRFVGSHLILHDSTANIIVDYILDAVPVRLSEVHPSKDVVCVEL